MSDFFKIIGPWFVILVILVMLFTAIKLPGVVRSTEANYGEPCAFIRATAFFGGWPLGLRGNFFRFTVYKEVLTVGSLGSVWATSLQKVEVVNINRTGDCLELRIRGIRTRIYSSEDKIEKFAATLEKVVAKAKGVEIRSSVVRMGPKVEIYD